MLKKAGSTLALALAGSPCLVPADDASETAPGEPEPVAEASAAFTTNKPGLHPEVAIADEPVGQSAEALVSMAAKPRPTKFVQGNLNDGKNPGCTKRCNRISANLCGGPKRPCASSSRTSSPSPDPPRDAGAHRRWSAAAHDQVTGAARSGGRQAAPG